MPERRDRVIIAFDFGQRKMGVAVGQTVTGTANPLPPLKATSGQPNWQQVKGLLDEWQPEQLVVGYPLNMDDTEQLLSQQAKKFANRLHGRFGIKVSLMDERLSSVSARQELFEQQGYRGLQKHSVDSIAACHILESWFREKQT